MRSNWFFAVAGFCLVVSFLLSESYPTAVAQEGAGRASLTIDLVGFKDTSGKATICLFDNENSFKSADMRKDRKEVEKYFRSLVDVPIQVAGNNLSAKCKIENLQPGRIRRVCLSRWKWKRQSGLEFCGRAHRGVRLFQRYPASSFPDSQGPDVEGSLVRRAARRK